MQHLGNLRVDATRDNLRTISFFVHGIAQRLEISEQALFDIELAVEEAATNIINHAYGEQNQQQMELHARLDGDRLMIILTDWGIPFDPANVKPFDIHAPIESRIHGGMGLHFIYNLMDKVERETATQPGEPNRLILTKIIQRTPRQRLRHPNRELSALQTVSEVMTAGVSLDEMLSIIVNKLVETIGAERGTLYLIDEATQECYSRVLAETENDLTEIRLKIGEGIAGTVAKTGEILNIPDAHAHPLFNPDVDLRSGYLTKNILAVPIRNPAQKVIGVVQLLNKADGMFTQADARLLTAMASQAAISIENARLQEQVLQQRLIERELQTARDIQQSFLPESVPEIEGWDIAAFWKPMEGVAGDFYDLYPLADGRLALVIADVSGKGIPSALFMALCVTMLRFGMSMGMPPKQMIDRANQLIIQQQRSRMFATIFVSYLHLQTGAMQYISAGHNPPMVYRAARDTMEYINAKGVAVGVFEQAKYEEKFLIVEPHDVFVLYTDGITEIINEDEEEFDETRLESVIRTYADQPAQVIAAKIIEACHVFAGNMQSFDDETLLVVKRGA